MKALYSAKATAQGGRDSSVKTEDGTIDFDLSIPKGLGGSGGKGANPEQFFAAGYSACYGSALAHVAREHKIDLGDYTVTATVKIGKNEDDMFQLEVILDSYLPTVDTETGEMLVNEAHEVCPYSRATQDNIDVTLNLLLDSDDDEEE
ncbi:organic hydroperoxide resistance protein [Leeuwenhoekiella sp. A16]|uniref:organic hydroperoxide resistance protein n=1 Tax=unclassified Leeuwenhoekiella TaxID=2615029 RepID=UPI003A7F80B9|tara:strand:+ start:114 stop:557 length:444 start_codon:yes stop_codon:yes gene_type:complete